MKPCKQPTTEEIRARHESFKTWPEIKIDTGAGGLISNGIGTQINLIHKDRGELLDALKEIEELQDTIYDLQMADPHLDFISRVQDAGMHHEWNEFLDALTAAEKPHD